MKSFFQINEIPNKNRWNQYLIGEILFKRTIRQMIIHHTGGLHVGIADRCAEKLKAAFFHVLADRVGDRGTGRCAT